MSDDRTPPPTNTDSGPSVRSFGGATDCLYTCAATHDGCLVIASGHASVLQAWDANGGQAAGAFPAP